MRTDMPGRGLAPAGPADRRVCAVNRRVVAHRWLFIGALIIAWQEKSWVPRVQRLSLDGWARLAQRRAK
jgi:hypothetical protein